MLGDREMTITISRGWDLLSLYDRVRLVCDFVCLFCLPTRTARRWVGLPIYVLPVRRGSDAMSEVLVWMCERYPSLAPLLREQEEYLLSSLQKLDQVKVTHTQTHTHTHTHGGSAGGVVRDGDRAVVVAVVGAAHLDYVMMNWGAVVDRRRLVSSRYRRGGGVGAAGGGVGGKWVWICVGVVGLCVCGWFFYHIILFLSAPPLQQQQGVLMGKKGNPVGVAF